MRLRPAFTAVLLLVTLSLLVSACQPAAGPEPTALPPTASLPSAVPATPTATPVPPRNLVVCVGQEPQSLYVYGGASRSMWSVLEGVYDGPFDSVDYAARPVILQKMPTLADGDAGFHPVTVRQGAEIVDANGNLVSLENGTLYYPSGCNDAGCAASYDGASEVQLDQMTVTFRLLPGVLWSDGQPLTAADSVFSFNLSADAGTPVSKRVVDRTASYVAADEQTVQWTGKPGYRAARFDTHFWLPLPRHQLEGKSAADLLVAEETTRRPLGWGAYVISEWAAGDHITLQKNPNYFRAGEGLPKFDSLVYRFLGEQADNNLVALQNGECDIVDQTTLLDEQLEQVLDLQKAGKLTASIGQGPEWEHIVFGIKPAAFDDPLNAERRPDFFGDARARQAFAYCLDRQSAVDKQLLDAADIPDGFLPPDHPLLAQGVAQYSYDVAKGSALLDEVGWKDDDNDATTPRVAYGVAGVPDGTKLSVRYLTTQAYLRGEVAKKLVELAAPCGIELVVEALPPDQLYAPGPEGVLFGRKFDMAQFAWQTDPQAPCTLFDSAQIPAEPNYWVGANVSGFSDANFDAACRTARQLLPGQPGYAEASAEIQRQFASQLPAIPLYFQLKIAAARPDLCGLDVDVSARSALWNLEALDYGEGCPK